MSKIHFIFQKSRPGFRAAFERASSALVVCPGKTRCDLSFPYVDLRSGNAFLSDIGVMPRDERPSPSEPVAATAPGESCWSAQTLMNAFGKKLPWWLRKMGVRDNEIEDAFQDVFIEVLNEQDKIPADNKSAQEELIRLASRVACRRKRAVQRDERHVSDVETHDPTNREEWIAARMLWAEAINVLDEQAKKLFIAHDIEGRSYADIAAEMGEKEDTIEKRGAKAKSRLRAEIIRLLSKNDKRNGTSNASLALVLGLDTFDRALFRTMFELDEPVSAPPPTIAKVLPTIPLGPLLGAVPVGFLIGAILMLSGESPKPSVLRAAKWVDVQLANIVVHAEMPYGTAPVETNAGTNSTNGSALPQKALIEQAKGKVKLDKATKASVVRVGTPSL